MKTRNGLVSNSSSSSFIVRGIKINIKILCGLIGKIPFPEDQKINKIYELDKFIVSEYKCYLDIIAMKNYFDFDGEFEDVILGLHSKTAFDDGAIIEISEPDGIDSTV
jgi:hypothetical protein